MSYQLSSLSWRVLVADRVGDLLVRNLIAAAYDGCTYLGDAVMADLGLRGYRVAQTLRLGHIRAKPGAIFHRYREGLRAAIRLKLGGLKIGLAYVIRALNLGISTDGHLSTLHMRNIGLLSHHFRDFSISFAIPNPPCAAMPWAIVWMPRSFNVPSPSS